MIMRALILLCCLMAGAATRAAELMIEITQGSDDPTKIAVVPSSASTCTIISAPDMT